MTYRVIATPAGKSLFDYSVAGLPVHGRSSEPLLDACRQLKRMGEPITSLCALYHEGSSVWALRCPIGVGAELTAGEGHFRPYRQTHKCLT